jgi:hypothetical protein
MRMRPVTVVSAMTTVLTIAGLAMAMVVPSAGTAAPRLPKVDLSTDAAVHDYLRSVGVDPATTVIQRGLRNYAGPRCPGIGWNCTTATAVVQIATAGGTNMYEGNPEFFANGDPPFPLPNSFVTLSPPTGTPCTVIQEVPAEGQNHVRCFQRSTTTPVAALEILVVQQNEFGDNFFQGHQQIRQREGAIQEADADAEVMQTNLAGDNHLHLISQISQFSSETTDALAPLQDQDGDFDAVLEQNTETGNNLGELFQELNQDGRAKGSDATEQIQSADADGEVDQYATGPLTILSNGGGQGFSKFFAHQSKSQRLTGPGIQTQDDPARCCGVGTQRGDPQQTSMKILLESDQSASQGTAAQELLLAASCDSNGLCEETNKGRNDEDSIVSMNEGTGPTFLTTECESVEAEDNEGSGECESTEVEPPGD